VKLFGELFSIGGEWTKVSGGLSLTSITDDSREVRPGSCFVAVKGAKRDGHDLIEAVLASGAAAVVVENEELFRRYSRTAWVPSTRRALADAAARWYGVASSKLRIAGVTGTNGKTTTTFLLREVWDVLNIKSGVIGTVENRIGDRRLTSSLTTPGPLALQKLFDEMVRESVSHVAIEVSSIALDQERTAGTQFGVGIFTNLTQDHLDYHGTFESYFASKLKFFREYNLPAAVINLDDPWGRRLTRESIAGRVVTFGVEDRTADFHVEQAAFDRRGTTAIVVTPDGRFDFTTPLIGVHNLYNCLGVIAAAEALGHSPAKVIAALRSAKGAPGRLERAETPPGGPNVFVDYAHSADALENVLRALIKLRGEGPGRIITVFGCGGDRDRGKRPKMAGVVSSLSEVTIATSDNPRTEDPQKILDDVEVGINRAATDYHREVDRRTAIGRALELARPEDFVLVAGKGHETYQIIGTTQIPFDDRLVIRDHYTKQS